MVFSMPALHAATIRLRFHNFCVCVSKWQLIEIHFNEIFGTCNQLAALNLVSVVASRNIEMRRKYH